MLDDALGASPNSTNGKVHGGELTPRQTNVAALIAQGLSNEQIARRSWHIFWSIWNSDPGAGRHVDSYTAAHQSIGGRDGASRAPA